MATKKQRLLQEKERQRRLDVVQGWLNEKNAKHNNMILLLQVNRSHADRLVEWLMEKVRAAASDKGELPPVDITVLHIDKSTTLLLCSSCHVDDDACPTLPDLLRRHIHSTWYVKSHVQRVIPVENDNIDNVIIEGKLQQLASRILHNVQRQLVLEEGSRGDVKEGSTSSEASKAAIIRLHTFPVRLEKPLLQELWKQIDASTNVNFDFAQEHATHTMAVVRVYDGGDNDDDDDDCVYIVGSLESLPAAAALPQTGAAPQEDEAFPPQTTTIDTAQDDDHHDDWGIALYYIYLDIADLQDHVAFHQQLCEQNNLKGRIRVSHEGVNGVLSGLFQNLQQYERAFQERIQEMQQPKNDDISTDNNDNNSSSDSSYPHRLDMKYCHLRKDLSVQEQLFDALVVKQTKTVISLFDNCGDAADKNNGNKKKKMYNRYQRRKQRDRNAKQQQEQELGDNDADDEDSNTAQRVDPLLHEAVMGQPLQAASSSSHLSACEWNRKLDAISCDNQALLLDARNCYESRVGHFCHPTTPTLLTNTRKYSDLPLILENNKQLQDPTRQHVFMYCTGGVRCERVSMLVKELYPDKQVYQLKGGIQTYLREVCASASTSEMVEGEDGNGTSTLDNDDNGNRKNQQYFVGKNFVFDPRRTDPVHFGQVIGKCLVCGMPHDDYDNGNAPKSGKEARCNGCRMLILLCNKCRPDWTCHGEDEASGRPKIYCKVDHCNHEGAAPEPEFVVAGSQKATLLNSEGPDLGNAVESALASDATAVNRAFWKLKEAWQRFQHHESVKALQWENTSRRPVIAIDCGAAPGGWTQFLVDEVGCDKVYAIDPAALSNAVTTRENAHKICHLAMKSDKAIPHLANELLCEGNDIVAPSPPPISFWVCDVNARDESFVVDTLLEAADYKLIGRGTMFVLTIKCAHGHTAETYDHLVGEQVMRLRNSNNRCVSFDYDIEVLHLFSNRVRERTVLGLCK